MSVTDDGVRIQLIYKSAGQPLSGRRVIALHAQVSRRVAADRAFENGHQRLVVAGQVHGLEAARCAQPRDRRRCASTSG